MCAPVDRSGLTTCVPRYNERTLEEEEWARVLSHLFSMCAWRNLNTALFYCAQSGEVDLLRHALDANKTLEFGAEGRVVAVNKHFSSVSYKGYIRDWKHPQVNGWTACHAAAQQGHTACLSVLFDHGFPRDQRDDDGLTVQDIAEAFGHKGMCAWLRQYKDPEERDLIARKEKSRRDRELNAERKAMDQVEYETEMQAEARGYKRGDTVKLWWYDFNEAYEGELISFCAEKIVVKVGHSPRVVDEKTGEKTEERDLTQGIVKLAVDHGRVFCKTGALVLYDGVDKKLHPLEEFYRAIEYAQIDEEDGRMTKIRRLEMEAAAKKAASDKKKADKAARKKLKADFKAEQKRLDEEAKKAMEEEFDAEKLKKMKKAYDKEKKEKKKADLKAMKKKMTGY